MAGDVRYPSLYQINTRVWLRRLSRQQGKAVTQGRSAYLNRIQSSRRLEREAWRNLELMLGDHTKLLSCKWPGPTGPVGAPEEKCLAIMPEPALVGIGRCEGACRFRAQAVPSRPQAGSSVPGQERPLPRLPSPVSLRQRTMPLKTESDVIGEERRVTTARC